MLLNILIEEECRRFVVGKYLMMRYSIFCKKKNEIIQIFKLQKKVFYCYFIFQVLNKSMNSINVYVYLFISVFKLFY